MEMSIHQIDKSKLYLALRIYGKKLRESQRYSDINEEEVKRLEKIRPIPTQRPQYLVSRPSREFKHEIKPFSVESLKENEASLEDLIVIKSIDNGKLEGVPVKEEIIHKGYSVQYEEIQNETFIEEENDNSSFIDPLEMVKNLLTPEETEFSGGLATEEEFSYFEEQEENSDWEDEDGFIEEEEWEEETEDEEEDEWQTEEDDEEEDYYEEETVDEPIIELKPVKKELPTVSRKNRTKKKKPEPVKEQKDFPNSIEELIEENSGSSKVLTRREERNKANDRKFLLGIEDLRKRTDLTPNLKQQEWERLLRESIYLFLQSNPDSTERDILDHYEKLYKGLSARISKQFAVLKSTQKVLHSNGKYRVR